MKILILLWILFSCNSDQFRATITDVVGMFSRKLGKKIYQVLIVEDTVKEKINIIASPDMKELRFEKDAF